MKMDERLLRNTSHVKFSFAFDTFNIHSIRTILDEMCPSQLFSFFLIESRKGTGKINVFELNQDEKESKCVFATC